MVLNTVVSSYRSFYLEGPAQVDPLASYGKQTGKQMVRAKARYPKLNKNWQAMKKPAHLLFLLLISPGLLLVALVLCATGYLKLPALSSRQRLFFSHLMARGKDFWLHLRNRKLERKHAN
ncbi:MAG: hypothetical protein K0S07_708 [Chlamydiales bacterium]|jgi:hypothetical protein|nr:hypothetical protein [Chlamydiales bacterium]